MAAPTTFVPDVDAVRSDGGLVHIRAAHAADLPALHAMVAGLSDISVYRRFFSVSRHGADDYLDHAIGQSTSGHVALVAIIRDDIVGLGSYDVVGEEKAEFAVLVADDFQHKGVGTLLLENLADLAREAGVRRFIGQVLASNADMVHVVHDLNLHTDTSNDRELVCVDLDLTPAPDALTAMSERERVADAASVRPLLDPSSVAVIGASGRPGSIGHQIMVNLLAGFRGTVYPVNPTRDLLFGKTCYASPIDLPEPVDLAVIAVPAGAVPDVLRQCGERGVRSALLITAGFGEAGTGGQTLQAEVLGIVRSYGMRLVGPNCVGIVNTDPAVGLNATFGALQLQAGTFSLVSQSGAFGLGLLAAAARAGVGISQFVSVGNKADVSGNDLLLAWEKDPRTQVIGMYLESVADARRFVRIASRVSRRKPILAVKSGRTSAGQRAGASHTAAAATSDVAMDAMFAAAGVIRVGSVAEMLDAAHVLTQQPLPTGRRVVIVGNSGGPGILAADAAAKAGLELVELDAATQQRLHAAAPSVASTQNPVDLGATVPPDQVAAALATVLDLPDVDVVLALFTDVGVTDGTSVMSEVAIAATRTSKTVVAAHIGGQQDTITVPGASVALPVFDSAEAASAAIGVACSCASVQAQGAAPAPHYIDVDRASARRIVTSAIENGADWLDPEQVAALLECYRVPVAAQRVVRTIGHAVQAAGQIGYPIAVKIVAPGIVHKTDVGAVVLGIVNEQRLRTVLAGLDEAFPTEHRVLVQAMAAAGTELIVGAVRDPDVGPMVMVGAGGVLADLLGDRTFRLAPLTTETATQMLASLRVSRLLDGYRGWPAADRAAAVDAIVRVAALAADLAQVAELDVNPLVCGPGGVVAIDARIRLAPTPPISSELTRHLRPAPATASKERHDEQ